MNQLKEYGYQGAESVQEAIEKFAVDLMMLMCGCPKKIVLDRHTHNRYVLEMLKRTTNRDAPYTTDEHAVIRKALGLINTSAGTIEIVCED